MVNLWCVPIGFVKSWKKIQFLWDRYLKSYEWPKCKSALVDLVSILGSLKTFVLFTFSFLVTICIAYIRNDQSLGESFVCCGNSVKDIQTNLLLTYGCKVASNWNKLWLSAHLGSHLKLSLVRKGHFMIKAWTKNGFLAYS